MRVLSGMRPTGKLHIGHLFGAMKSWVQLQEKHETFYFVADWHALTTMYDNPKEIPENIKQMVADWLAMGLDPEKSVIFVQSKVKEHAELYLLLGMIVPLSWLERNPTYKEAVKESAKDIRNYGFLGYPVLQAADILIYKAEGVPVGADQVPHLELTREIARRFNYFYGPTFPEPQAILTETPKIPGIDGRKMSKSYNNAVFIADKPEEINKKILSMFTDPLRPYKKDPGHPDRCPVFSLHGAFTDAETRNQIEKDCRGAIIGCKDCKAMLAKRVIEFLTPLREKRENILKKPGLIRDILEEGSQKAREIASKTMEEVRQKVCTG